MISSDVKVRKVSSIPRSYPKATATNRKKKKKKKKRKMVKLCVPIAVNEFNCEKRARHEKSSILDPGNQRLSWLS